ncbi:MAG: HAD-IIB family hydrolase [Bacillota bacterium]|nr:HAD-IIB family hydrolase [Bacillota bacterium]
MRKLVATDYDGTLKYTNVVLEEDKQAIQKWKQEGNLFVIDTGRSMESISEQASKYDLPVDYFITNNGGMVFNKDKEVLFSSYLDNETSFSIIEYIKTIPGVVSYVVNDGIIRHRIVLDDSLEEKRYPGLEPDLSEEEVLKMGNYAQIVISMDTMEQAASLSKKINEMYSNTIVAYGNKYVVDVVVKGISKATGLQFVVDYEKINMEDVYPIGDADNDIALMEYNENGACMNSAQEEVKGHAKRFYNSVGEMIHTILG